MLDYQHKLIISKFLGEWITLLINNLKNNLASNANN